MCKMMSNYIQEFNTMFSRKINYLSPLIQNQLIEICAENVGSMIIDEVEKNGYFSVMCDEAR